MESDEFKAMSAGPAPLGDTPDPDDGESPPHQPTFPVPLRASPPPAGFRFKSDIRRAPPTPVSDWSTDVPEEAKEARDPKEPLPFERTQQRAFQPPTMPPVPAAALQPPTRGRSGWIVEDDDDPPRPALGYVAAPGRPAARQGPDSIIRTEAPVAPRPDSTPDVRPLPKAPARPAPNAHWYPAFEPEKERSQIWVVLDVARVGLLAVMAALLLFVAAAPTLLGWRFVTFDAKNMQPAISSDSLVVMKKADIKDIAVGDIVMFRNPPQPDQSVTQRVVEIQDGGKTLVTKSDATSAAGSETTKVPELYLRNVYLFTMPQPAGWLANSTGFSQGWLAIIVIPLLALSAWQLVSTAKMRKWI